jgi:transcription antitermination factor NusA-like protein
VFSFWGKTVIAIERKGTKASSELAAKVFPYEDTTHGKAEIFMVVDRSVLSKAISKSGRNILVVALTGS